MVEPEQSVLLGVLAENYHCSTTKNAALLSHLAINGARAKHVQLNTECNKNGNGMKTER